MELGCRIYKISGSHLAKGLFKNVRIKKKWEKGADVLISAESWEFIPATVDLSRFEYMESFPGKMLLDFLNSLNRRSKSDSVIYF